MLERFQGDSTLGFLVRGSFASLATRIVGVGLSYCAAVVLSRTLGAKGYGTYAVALAWAMILVLPSRAGLDFAALRYASTYFEEKQTGSLQALIRFAAIGIFGLSCITGALVYGLSMAGLTSIPAALAPGVALLVLPVAALALVAALLRAARRIVASQFYEQILRPALLILSLAIAVLAGGAISAAEAMLLTAASAALALAFGAVHVVRSMGERQQPDYRQWRTWIALSLPVFFIAVVQELLNQLDIIMLGYLDTATAAGLYAAAWRLASLVTFGLVALSTVSGPMIAAAHARHDFADLARIARLAARFGFAASLCLAVVLIVAGRDILLLFGPEFVRAYPVVVILLAGGLTNAFTGAVVYLVTMTGRQLSALWMFLGALAVSAALNFLLIPHLSIVGAAIASSSATVFWNVAMLIYVRRQLGIDASALARAPLEALQAGGAGAKSMSIEPCAE